MSNLVTIGEAIGNALITWVRIDRWGLDNPTDLYSPYSTTTSVPANSAIALPVQNVLHNKSGYNQINTQARFPYRIGYRFPGEMAFSAIPFSALEGILVNIQVLAVLQYPDNNITHFAPVQLEDAITVARAQEVNGNNSDWLVYLNIAFDATFYTTTMPDVSLIQPQNYYNVSDPPPLNDLNIRVYRAKENFNTDASVMLPLPMPNTTFTLDTIININNTQQ